MFKPQLFIHIITIIGVVCLQVKLCGSHDEALYKSTFTFTYNQTNQIKYTLYSAIYCKQIRGACCIVAENSLKFTNFSANVKFVNKYIAYQLGLPYYFMNQWLTPLFLHNTRQFFCNCSKLYVIVTFL